MDSHATFCSWQTFNTCFLIQLSTEADPETRIWVQVRRRGRQRMRQLDGFTKQWTWTWANFGRWWETGKPGVLKTMGSQRVRRDRVTEQQQVYLRVIPGNTSRGAEAWDSHWRVYCQTRSLIPLETLGREWKICFRHPSPLTEGTGISIHKLLAGISVLVLLPCCAAEQPKTCIYTPKKREKKPPKQEM